MSKYYIIFHDKITEYKLQRANHLCGTEALLVDNMYM